MLIVIGTALWCVCGALGSEVGRWDVNRIGKGLIPRTPPFDAWWWEGVAFGPFALIGMLLSIGK